MRTSIYNALAFVERTKCHYSIRLLCFFPSALDISSICDFLSLEECQPEHSLMKHRWYRLRLKSFQKNSPFKNLLRWRPNRWSFFCEHRNHIDRVIKSYLGLRGRAQGSFYQLLFYKDCTHIGTNWLLMWTLLWYPLFVCLHSKRMHGKKEQHVSVADAGWESCIGHY